MNTCYFTGRTTKDIELQQSKNGNAYCRFSMGVDTYFNGKRKENFLNFVAFGKLAENLSKYATKGVKLIVECEAKQNLYDGKNGKVNTVDFTVQKFEFADSRKQSESENENKEPVNTQPEGDPVGNDDDFLNLDIPEDEMPFL